MAIILGGRWLCGLFFISWVLRMTQARRILGHSHAKQHQVFLELPQSLRVVKVIAVTESPRVCLSFKFRNSSFFSEFFKKFEMNVSFYYFSREYSPLMGWSPFFTWDVRFLRAGISWLCVSALWQKPSAWLFGTSLSLILFSLSCTCNTEFICFFRTYHTLSPLCLFTCCPLHFGAHRSPVESNL